MKILAKLLLVSVLALGVTVGIGSHSKTHESASTLIVPNSTDPGTGGG